MDVLKTLGHVFPPPRFMTLPAMGVDISDASLKYVQFRAHGKRLMLAKWGDLSIPKDTVMRGEVKNSKALVELLVRLRKETGAEYVRVSLPEERAYLFETTLPAQTKTRDIRSMLEFRLEENVPLQPRDALFDYAVLPDEGQRRDMRLSVAVYARDTINTYYEACREAGLVPTAFEVEAQAIARAAVPRGDKGTYLLVDFGQTRTGVGIVHQGALMFTSTIEIGGVELSEALRAHAGATDEAACTRLKNDFGLLRAEGGADVHAALLPVVSALKDELMMRISYWNLRDEGVGNDRDITRVILCGGSANLAGLPEYLSEELGVETKRAEVWQNAFSFTDMVPPITRRYSYGYATAIGLGLADFSKSL